MGILLHLKPSSAEGKKLIREHGQLWRLTNTWDKVSFSDNSGPWYHIQSLRNPNYGKWIHANDDTDFRVIERIEVVVPQSY
jgi:hypothetical protein